MRLNPRGYVLFEFVVPVAVRVHREPARAYEGSPAIEAGALSLLQRRAVVDRSPSSSSGSLSSSYLRSV